MKFDVSPAVWQFWSLLVLAIAVFLALLTDLRGRRISNELTFSSLGLGFVSQVLGPAGSSGMFSGNPGALGIQGAALGALVGLLVFLPLYAVRAMGAGDIKLMAAVGSFAGPVDALNLALFILVMGGALALVRMLLAGSSRRVLVNLHLMLEPVRVGGPRRFDPATQSADRMPYSVAIAAGLLAYGAWLWLWGSPPLRF